MTEDEKIDWNQWGKKVIQKAQEAEIKIVVEHDGKRVSINKRHESIWLDTVGDKVHISATSRNGSYSVATLKFLKDEVVREK